MDNHLIINILNHSLFKIKVMTKLLNNDSDDNFKEKREEDNNLCLPNINIIFETFSDIFPT